MARYLVPLGLFAVLVVFLAIGLGLNPREVPSPLIDKPAPEFTLPSVKNPGRTVSLSDLKKDVTVFNVWASWCVSCRQEHPLLVALARRGGVNIYGLNYKDTREAALGWLAQLGDPYIDSAFDEQGRVGIDWGVYGVPETFVVDRQGVIRFKHAGPITEELWQTRILPLLEQLRSQKG
jgi:cytochrome c biogenesis protein CcmG/thiol:disulfide interchange protein DsbE